MFDFQRLRDPEVLAKLRAEREAEETAREAVKQLHRDQIQRCLDHYEALPKHEREFVLSCRTRTGLWLDLTEKQAKWLSDIAARFPEAKGSSS